MLCILYVNVIGALLGVVGLLTERALPGAWARRWVWCLVIAISVTIPGVYQAQHNWSVIDALEQTAGHTNQGQRATISLAVLDPEWWAHTRSYDTVINRYWLIASGVLLLWGLANAGRVSRVISVSRRGRGSSRRTAVVDGIPVVVTDSVGPATVGLWRSRVLVPRWVLALPGSQRRYVLRHEEEHRSAHDARLLFIASLTLLLLPWSLALWWQLWRLRLAVEMDCDNRVVAALGDAPAYGGLLLKVAEAASRGPRLQPAFLGGIGSLERRLTALLEPTPLRHVQRFLVPAMAIALLFVVFSMPHPVLGRGSKAHVTTTSAAMTTSQGLHSAPESSAANRP
jgi:bla regulator protein blaR1